MIRILIVDDHPVVRDGLAALLATVDSVTVVGGAGTADEAVDAALAHQPDVVIMDLNLGESSGFDAIARIGSAAPVARIVVLSMFGDEESVRRALTAGAHGYLLKGATQGEILRAITTVAAGGAMFSAAAAAPFLARIKATDPTPSPFPQLTRREDEVLRCLAAGLDNRSIAQRLGLSAKTIANQLSNIYTKLHVQDRSQALILARDAGYR